MSEAPTIKKGIYRHVKTGNTYKVLGVALQTESEEMLVVYQPLIAKEYELFARPYDMFVETVEINGVRTARFEFVGE